MDGTGATTSFICALPILSCYKPKHWTNWTTFPMLRLNWTRSGSGPTFRKKNLPPRKTCGWQLKKNGCWNWPWKGTGGLTSNVQAAPLKWWKKPVHAGQTRNTHILTRTTCCGQSHRLKLTKTQTWHKTRAISFKHFIDRMTRSHPINNLANNFLKALNFGKDTIKTKSK